MKFLAKFKHLFDPIDLTKGSLWKGLLVFSIPIILSMLFQQIYTLTDAMIVGQTLSEAEIAGVNNSGPLIFMVLDFGIGCTAGFSVVIAEAIGAKNGKGMRQSYFIQIILCFIVSLLLTGIGIAVLPFLLQYMGIQNSATDASMAATYQAAYTYIAIIFGGILCQVFYNMIVAVLRAIGDSFVPFLFLFASTILNIGLDCLFIMVFHWGVAGSAIATVLSQGIAAGGAMIYAYLHYPYLRIKKEDTKASWAAYWRHIYNGFPLGFQFSVLAIGIIVMQSAVIAFDVDATGKMIASMPAELGYGAACKIINVLMVPFQAIGTALLAFTGQNVGAGNGERVKKGFWVSFWIGMIFYGIALTIGLLLTINGAYQYIFLSPSKITPESIAYGNAYLYASVPSLVILLVLFLVRNALQGLEKPFWPLMSGVGELVARVVICTFVPAWIAGCAINSSAGIIPFYGVVLGDPGAWLLSPLVSLIPLIMCFKKLPTKKKADDAKEPSNGNSTISK